VSFSHPPFLNPFAWVRLEKMLSSREAFLREGKMFRVSGVADRYGNCRAGQLTEG
jgi:hypothetical protein